MQYNSREERITALTDLVKKFEQNIDEYKSPNYKEANLRTDFLNPFFGILDWDIRNEAGKSESYRDVIIEDRLEIAGSNKAPDFCFKIGKERKFYVEAKKPAVNIKDDIEPSLQARRYGYSAGLMLSMLTDFEEISIYDTSIKPQKNDKADKARIRFLHYKNFVAEFDYLYNTFSKTAIEQGSFDKYAEGSKNKRGTQDLDKGLLELVENARLLLAKNISKLNEIDVDGLNKAVVTIIDRIIFLKIAEDKRLEEYGTLLRAANSSEPYKTLKKIFQDANERYNSGLFADEKQRQANNDLPLQRQNKMQEIVGANNRLSAVVSTLNIDNKILKQIIEQFYYPECPYEFSVLPVSILGNIYEQFLGQTIRQTESGMVKIEEKPSVRKAGGVYYTPEYIVNYIVKNTVGAKLQIVGANNLMPAVSPKQIQTLKILDPACGSGSFLINAYQYLLDYHLTYYSRPENFRAAIKSGAIYQTQNDKFSYRLSIPKKQEILKNNIFGVDIDAQAVEVTKFSLLIKLLESEDAQSAGELFNISKVESNKDMKILPDLSDNIKCGNSLISKDFLADNLLIDNEEIKKVNPFDWNEAFPETMKSGGFDIVIGNPPYGAELTEKEREYLDYKYNVGNTDTACLFLFHVKKLSKQNALNGFIIPKAFTYASNWEKARNLLLQDITNIVDCSKVWKEVKLEMTIYIAQKDSGDKAFMSAMRNGQEIHEIGKIDKKLCAEFEFILNGVSKSDISIGLKMKQQSKMLNDFVINQRGGMFQDKISNVGNVKVLGGKQIQRFFISNAIKGKISKIDISDDVKSFLKPNAILVQNIVAHVMNPYPRIMIMATISEVVDNTKEYAIVDTINQLENTSNLSSKYICAILNSKLISWYLYKFIFANAIRTMHFDNSITSRIPIVEPSSDIQKKIVSLVDIMLTIKKQQHTDFERAGLKPAPTKSDIKIYQQKADIIDKQIDSLVYNLYGLTQEEIKIVEGQ